MSDSDHPGELPNPHINLDLDKLLQENSGVNEAQIREVQAYLRTRRKDGRRTSYRLDSPYQRRAKPSALRKSEPRSN